MKKSNKVLLLLSCGMLLAACGNNDASSHATGLASSQSHDTGLASSQSHDTGLASSQSHGTGLTSEESSHATGLTSEESSHATGLTSEESSHATGLTSEDSHDTGLTSEDSHDTGFSSEEPSRPLHTWALVGNAANVGSWDNTKGAALTYDDATKLHSIEILLEKGTEFKAFTDNSWNNEIASEFVTKLNDETVLTLNGTNPKVMKSGTFAITIHDDILTMDNKVDGVTIQFTEYVAPYRHSWFMVGSDSQIGGPWWNFVDSGKFSFDETTKKHTLSLDLPASTQFKVVPDRDWSLAALQLDAELVEKVNDESILKLTGNDNNPTLMQKGKLTIVIDDDIEDLENILDGFTVDFVPDVSRPYHTWSVVGAGERFGNWNPDNGIPFTYDEETELHEVEFDVMPGDEFQILADNAWDIRLIDAIPQELDDDEVLIATGGEFNNIKALQQGTLTILIADDIDVTDPGESLLVLFEGEEHEPEIVSLYFVDKGWWAGDNAASHAYVSNDSSAAAQWPGEAMFPAGKINGNNVWSVLVDASIYTKVAFTRCDPNSGAYWDAHTVDIVLAEYSDMDYPMFVLSDEQAWGQTQAAVTVQEFDPELLDDDTANPLPVIAAGNSATRVEGAGVMIYLDNTNLGINGANALDIIGETTIDYGVQCPDHADFFTADDFYINGSQLDDYGENTVRLYVTFSKGFAADWEYELEISVSMTVGDEEYVGTVRFVNGNYVPANVD